MILFYGIKFGLDELFTKYDYKERTKLASVNKMVFDKEDVEKRDEYYDALTHYDQQKNSKTMLEFKDTILNGPSYATKFRLEEIDYSKTSYYYNRIDKIEYSNDVTQPKIKLIYEDKYYATDDEGKKGQVAEKATWPNRYTTLVLPKEDDNE